MPSCSQAFLTIIRSVHVHVFIAALFESPETSEYPPLLLRSDMKKFRYTVRLTSMSKLPVFTMCSTMFISWQAVCLTIAISFNYSLNVPHKIVASLTDRSLLSLQRVFAADRIDEKRPASHVTFFLDFAAIVLTLPVPSLIVNKFCFLLRLLALSGVLMVLWLELGFFSFFFSSFCGYFTKRFSSTLWATMG